MPTANDPFMREAISLARANITQGGRPFGAVVARDGERIASAANRIHDTCDPTAHAELLAIREAGRLLRSPRLDGCVVYASGHPCPMCLAAMHLCGVSAAYYAYSNEDGEPYGLSTAAIYAQMALPPAAQSIVVAQSRPAMENGLYAEWAALR
ncbi:cytidine/deoxycytidylate deaminase-like protein [Luteimonas cucumeris]|uniref:Cytidine/deoxycytidylate deaminase-like protein n=1 Tax=Luteimonas cucumeris TaxID=985012 RepID=A0A562L801_9GAMM|nr:nucleoside deaminase [Luteimonas cucumeris]TWI03584.1 cytidine/deoxycytidylate deaminase-like protein [Luteimonas cucumeris]